ncbi:MAG: Dabb family protein [Verrucomicrobia bacterium]|nr:Dabb family protein [Verrucomicrobiota bacterium]
MQFASQADYDFYNNHPTHVTYVQEIWLTEVAAFQEIDFIPHPHPDFSAN